MIQMLKLPFMQTALIGSLLVAIICSYIGVYIVLKRIVFVGAALANISTAGIALGLLIGFSPEISSTVSVIFSTIFAVLGIIILSLSVTASEKKIPRESIIGISYGVSSALAILLVSKSAQGEAHVLTLIFGDILAISIKQIISIALIFPFVMAIHFLFYKQFLFSSFDPEMAGTLGIKTRLWDMLLYLTLGITISAAIHVAGALLTFAYLVIPATTALLVTNRMKYVFILSVIFGVAASVLGMYFSYVIDLPSGPTIVVTSAVIFGITALINLIFGR